jgi:hypothetical protein
MKLIFENKIWKTRGFCSNMDLSDHAQIFHAGVSRARNLNKKASIVGN